MAPFSDIVMQHFLHPRGTGTLPAPTGEGWGGSIETSRFMRIQIQVVEEQVTAATFGTYGCAPAIAAGSWLCEWVMGRTVRDAGALTAEALLEALGGLPEHRQFCARLAVDALHDALSKAGFHPDKFEAKQP